MSYVTVSRRLSEVRAARGEDLPALAKRIGVREDHLRAIEQGRLADLPPGIYGRAAVRSFAHWCGFDPAEVLAECEPLLTPVEEPISALGRLRGGRPPKAMPLRAPANPAGPESEPKAPLTGCVSPGWRLLAAAALDAWVGGALLVVVVVCAIAAMMVPLSAIDESGGAFGVMGVLLGAAYFVWFGGLRGATVGEQVLRVEPGPPERATLTLPAIGARALLAATRDARFIQHLGAWSGTFLAQGRTRLRGDDIAGFEQPISR